MAALNQWKCTICNVVEPIDSKFAHNTSRLHCARVSSVGRNPWTCNVCELTMNPNNKFSHLNGANHRAAVEQAVKAPPTRVLCVDCGMMVSVAEEASHAATHAAIPDGRVWTCDVCSLTMPATQKDVHLTQVSHRSAIQANEDIGTGRDAPFGTVFWAAATNAARATAEALINLQTQLDDAIRDLDTTRMESASARKTWDEKEHALLLKMDELRAKIVSLHACLDATNAECTFQRNLRIAAELTIEQEKTRRMREAGVMEELRTKLKEALIDRGRLAEAVDRKAESIRTGQSVLSLARTKLSEVTSARNALRALSANLTATVDTLRKESAIQASQIQALQQQLDLANQRWSSHGQEITDEQLIWKDDEEVEAEKRQQEESVHQARERFEKMRRDELEHKAKEEARRRKCAEEKRAREAEEEKKRRNEEEARRMAAEKEEKEKRQAYEHWRNATALEILRHQMISRTRFQAHNGLWTASKALDRFLKLLGELPALAFSAQRPLTFWSVPWPILTNPLELDPGRLDWEATETFFLDAKDILPTEEYREMMLQAQRTFHPDRWVGKLALVLDGEARESLKKIIHTVAQVVNSLVTR